jgi:outer membrane murein-binding lipoprotein Lpp
MNALPTKRQPQTIERPQPKRKLKTRPSSHRGIAVELTLKLVFNGILCVSGIAAVVRLLPYHFLQEAKLHEVSTEVKETKQRVNRLNQDLSQNSDLQQTKNLRQQYSYRVAPDRRPVVWLETKPKQ